MRLRIRDILIDRRNYLLLFSLFIAGCSFPVLPIPSATFPPLPSANIGCANTEPGNHVYHPERLKILDPCISATGIVEAVVREADGDTHIRMKLDSGQQGLLAPGNIKQGGNLVVEIVCAFPVRQADAVSACDNWTNPIPVPRVGDHIYVVGSWVSDLGHTESPGPWNEIHPVYHLEIR